VVYALSNPYVPQLPCLPVGELEKKLLYMLCAELQYDVGKQLKQWRGEFAKYLYFVQKHKAMTVSCCFTRRVLSTHLKKGTSL
jgi:hypothetical protein